MKFLIEWDIKPKFRKDIMKVWEKYKQPESVKTIIPVHNCVGSNRGIAIVETESVEGLQETLDIFLDYVSFTVTPLLPFKRPK